MHSADSTHTEKIEMKGLDIMIQDISIQDSSADIHGGDGSKRDMTLQVPI